MELTSIIDGGGAPSVVAVAVKGASAGGIGGKGSRRAVRWAMENLFQKSDRFVLISIIPIINSVPTPSAGDQIPIAELDAKVVAMYVEEMKSKSQESLIPFKRLCKGRKIETLVVEGDDPASALVRYASDSGIDSLVLGSCSSNCLMRKLYGAGVPSAVLKHAPRTCNIYVVSRHGLISSSESRRRSSAISRLMCGLSSSSMEAGFQTTSIGSSAPNPKVNAEVEQLRLELRNAVNMYNQACEDLVVHTQNKVESLTRRAQLQEIELERTSKQLKEAIAFAGEESSKCKAAKEVIKSLRAQLKDMAERLPVGAAGNIKSPSFSSRSKDGHSRGDNEWVEQDEPGVYITLTSLPGGVKDLKRVRFSRKRFSEKQAEQWWAENRARVYEQYNVRMFDKSSVYS